MAIKTRKQVRVMEVRLNDLSRVKYNGEAGTSPNKVYFSMKSILGRAYGSMSESYMLNKVREIEEMAISPRLNRVKRLSAVNKGMQVAGKTAVVASYKSFVRVGTKTAQTIAKYNKFRNSIVDKKPLQTMISFKFTGSDTRETNRVAGQLILDALQYGIEDVDTGHVFERTFRSPSHFRAGGAWFSLFPKEYRSIFSFGFEENYETSFKTVASKWESQISLSLTNSLPVELSKIPNICVVQDLERNVVIDVDMVQEGTNETQHTMFGGHGQEDMPELDVKQIGEDELDFRFNIKTGKRMQTLTLTDGYMLICRNMAKEIRQSISYAPTEKELAYLNAFQFRMPFMKGMAVEFDIQAWCKEQGILAIKDIYGRVWKVEEIDMVVPESVFKGVDLFRETGIQGYVDRCLKGSFTFTGRENKLFGSRQPISFKYFNKNDFFRVVNINKAKEEYSSMTYQYLQALTLLDSDTATSLTDVIFEHARKCTSDINSARTLCGMLGEDTDDFNSSMVSKLQYILDLKPELFETNFVQKRIVKLVEKLVNDQRTGAVMVKGGYHFIISDPTLLLHGTPNEKGVLDGSNRPTLEADEQAGILAKGQSFLLGKETGDVVAGFRSPLIYESESAIIEFYTDELCNKWFGHLNGLLIFNGYDATALGMGGADYDGDKAEITDDKRIINGIRRRKDGSALPIIISPMENVKGTKQCISREGLLELDMRTLQNHTGEYTNMGTFYQNMLIHIQRAYGAFFKHYESQSRLNCYNYYKLLVPNTAYTAYSFEDDTVFNKAIEELNYRYQCLVVEYRYKIKVVRFGSASEIDFVKHGVRMPFPKEVTTTERIEWLALTSAEKKHKKNPIPEYAKLEVLEHNAPAYVWYTKNKETGEKVFHHIYALDTPMQRIFSHVNDTWKYIKDQTRSNSARGSILRMLLGDNAIEVLPQATLAMLDEVRTIRKAYGQEVQEVVGVATSEEESIQKVKDVYAYYTEKCMKFTDREAFALACLYLSQEGDSDDNFAMTVAFDGIVEMLVKQQQVSVRHIRIDAPKGTQYVTVESGEAYYTTATGECFGLELPSATILEDGEYPVVDSINARYITFNRVLSKEDKESMLKYAYNNVVNPARHTLALRSNVKYDIVIQGFKWQGCTAETALKAIREANGQAMFVKHEYLLKDGCTCEAVGVSVNGEVIAVVRDIDGIKATNTEYVDLTHMFDRVVKIDTSNSVAFDMQAVPPKMHNHLKVQVEVENFMPIDIKLEDWHSKCNFNKWYFATGYDEKGYKTLADYGYNLHSIELASKIRPNTLIAVLLLEKEGVITRVPVGYKNKEEGIGIGQVTRGNEVIDTTPAKYKNFLACIYREVSFAFAKRDYKPVEVVIESSEAFHATRKAFYVAKAKEARQVANLIKVNELKAKWEAKQALKALKAEKKAQEKERMSIIQFWKELSKEAQAEHFIDIHQYATYQAELKRISNL